MAHPTGRNFRFPARDAILAVLGFVLPVTPPSLWVEAEVTNQRRRQRTRGTRFTGAGVRHSDTARVASARTGSRTTVLGAPCAPVSPLESDGGGRAEGPG